MKYSIILGITLFLAGIARGDPISIGQGAQPRVVKDGDLIHVVFGRPKEILIATSEDQGKTFSAPRIVAKVATSPLGMRRGPRAVATKETLVITAIEGQQGGGKDGDIFAWVSHDHGKTWVKSAGPINSVAGAPREGLDGLGANENGVVACAWLDLRNLVPGTPGTQLWCAVSTDGGLTWKPDALAYRNPDGTICQCCHPSVLVDPKGNVQVLFRNARDGARDLYLTRSADSGKTFAPAQKLGQGTWPLNACPMDGGDLGLTATGEIETVWMRNGELFKARPGEREESLGKGRQPILVETAQGPFFAWTDGTSLLAHWGKSPALRLDNSAAFPTAVETANGVLLAWEHGKEIHVETVPKSQ